MRKALCDYLLSCMIMATVILAPFAATAQTPYDPEKAIDCDAGDWELLVVDPKDRLNTVIISRDAIMLCGWRKDGWEMFVVNRTGCMVRKEHRWWMSGADADRIRYCFR